MHAAVLNAVVDAYKKNQYYNITDSFIKDQLSDYYTAQEIFSTIRYAFSTEGGPTLAEQTGHAPSSLLSEILLQNGIPKKTGSTGEEYDVPDWNKVPDHFITPYMIAPDQIQTNRDAINNVTTSIVNDFDPNFIQCIKEILEPTQRY